MKKFLQIGTNNGNDLFRMKVLREKPELVILIEPNPGLIDTIKQNYSFFKGKLIIINKAIYYNDNENIQLYIPAKKGIFGTKADNGITYTDGNFSILPMNDWGDKEDMVKISTSTITFNSVMKNYKIDTLDYLEIDTEGFDYEIIKCIDFKNYKINKIKFEIFGFNTKCYSKYFPDIKERLGINGLNNILKMLKKLNYKIINVTDEFNVLNKLAILQE